jgi:hypothetical protein
LISTRKGPTKARGINHHGQLVGNFCFSEKGSGSFLATLQ